MTKTREQEWAEPATTVLDALRVPFKPHEISKLPKPYKADSQKGNCKECGGYHGLPAIHLDYVGHAALTKRLLETDPKWFWEPMAFGPDGLPAFDKIGGLWIRLTVAGHSRIGYGDSQGKTGPNAIKEAIGDALRNAGMRFGMALDLWHKGDLYDADELRGLAGEPEARPEQKQEHITPKSGAMDQFTPEQRREMEFTADEVTVRCRDMGAQAANDYIASFNFDSDYKVALWSLLDSKTRAALKKAHTEASK